MIVNATFVNDTLVRCVAPAEEVEAQSSAVQLSLNGQQFTVAVSFPFFAVHSISPTTGAATGGTLVTVNGTAFDAGECKGTGHCRFRCRFGACGGGDDGVCIAEASRVDSQTLRCHAPPRLNNDTGLFALEVSLNARDYTSNLVGYEYFAPLALDHPRALLPASGPEGGDTIVAVRAPPTAYALSRGSHLLCRFGAVSEGRDDVEVPATYIGNVPPVGSGGEAPPSARGPHNNGDYLDGGRLHCGGEAQRLAGPATARGCAAVDPPYGAILCVSPPRAAAANGTTIVPFAVSLNGRDFYNTSLPFTYYAPPLPSAVAPLRGPAAGLTRLTLVAAPLHPSLLNTTSCRVGLRGAAQPAVHSVRTLELMRPTGQIAADVLQCDVPGAEAAGARGTVSIDFARAPVAGSAHGDARHVPDHDRPCALGARHSCGGAAGDHYESATSAHCEWLCQVQSGILRLTAGGGGSAGSFLLRAPPAPLAPLPRSFNVSFDLLIHGVEPEGDGYVAVAYAELNDEHFGLRGAGRGLAVHLFPHRDAKLEVYYLGERLQTVDLGLLAPDLRTGSWTPMHVEVANKSLSVSIGRRLLVDRLRLIEWAPHHSWRWGWSSSSGPTSSDLIAIDNVRVDAVELLDTSAQPVAITLNGQQFHGLPAPFTYYGARRWPEIVSLSPSSGPVAGGTNLRLAVRAVDGDLSILSEDPRSATQVPAGPYARLAPAPLTSAYRCFVGPNGSWANISASYENGTVRCTTTADAVGDADGGEARSVRLAINAQDAFGPAAAFVVYPDPEADNASPGPFSGPVAGGTLVTFGGTNFGYGSDYRCRFGAGDAVDEAPGNDTVAATYDEGAGAIRCYAPPRDTAGAVELFLALNGQNYARAASLVFTYTKVLRPAARSPTSGPSGGGTIVRVTLPQHSVANMNDGVALKCRFGGAVVPAYADANKELRCQAPPAHFAPAVAELRMLYGMGDAPPEEWLHGHADLLESGALRLTDGDQGSAGAMLLPASALNTSGRASLSGGYRHFRATFHFRVHSGTGADGFSFSYGQLPAAAVGETGGGDGLRVSFLTAAPCAQVDDIFEPMPGGHRLRYFTTVHRCAVLTVRHAHTLLWNVSLDASFRSDAYQNATISFSHDGLYVQAGGRDYVPRGAIRHIPGYAPTSAWSFGFGARSGEQTDVHEIRDLSIALGTAVAATPVPLAVSLNAQQYAAVDGGFRYYGAPVVSVLSPSTGPAAGGLPQLLLGGGGLHTIASVRGGSDYRCRFGGDEWVRGTLAAEADEVYCTAPKGEAPLAAAVTLTLNGQQYHALPSNLTRHAPGTLTADFLSGPALGGTTVNISERFGDVLDGLGGGDDYRCRFGPLAPPNETRWDVADAEAAGLVVRATYDATSGTVACVSPPQQAGTVALQLALNAFHYRKVVDFDFYDVPIVSSLSPASGPVGGGAQLHVTGSGLGGGHFPQCWLGDGLSNATVSDGGASLRCVAPPGAAAAATPLRLALNAQQASAATDFGYYGPPTLTLLSPDNGDADASTGTTVRVVALPTGGGGAYANGTDYRCMFGGEGIVHGTRAPPHTLVCESPAGAAAGTHSVRVTLNGQQYGDGLPIVLRAAPRVTELVPSGGVWGGGSLVSVRGENFADSCDPASCELLCRFGSMGNATVEAEFISATEVRCVAPPADAAELADELRLDFDGDDAAALHANDDPAELELGGDATIEGGALVLTAAEPGHHGALLLRPRNRGTRFFAARFSLMIGGGAGGDGASFCYGDLSFEPDEEDDEVHFDELGGEGLCVRIRTHVFMFLEIAYNRTVLGRVNLTDPGARADSFVAIEFNRTAGGGAVAVYDADAGARAVSVEVSEADVASVYQPEAHWRFGFAARCGERYDAHVVDSLSIGSAAFVGEAPAVAVRVANNGQQFSTAAGAYSYYAPPEVSSISPNSGPTSGATVVRITGAQLAHGAAPYCRFAQAVGACAEGPTAAFDTCSDLVAAERVVVDGLPALECVSPDGLSEATLALEVTLNGVPAEWPGAQDFTTSTVLFDAVPPPNIAALSPSCGPTDGATQVNLTGSELPRGSDLRCRWSRDGTEREDTLPGGEVNASRNGDAGGSLQCSSPSAAAGTSAVAVSPNAQQFSPHTRDFYFYEPPVVSGSSPTTGPSAGRHRRRRPRVAAEAHHHL